MTYEQLVSPIRLYLRTLLVSFLPRRIVSEDLSIEQWPIFDQSSVIKSFPLPEIIQNIWLGPVELDLSHVVAIFGATLPLALLTALSFNRKSEKL